MSKIMSDCSSCGKQMLLIGGLVGAPLIILPFYPEEVQYAPAFLYPALISVVLGVLVCVFGKKDTDGSFEPRSLTESSSLVVLFAWGWGILFGSIPFVLGKQLAPVQALFETVSGWTTTGLSTMDVNITPKIYLFHRSFMQFCGGLGFVMMITMLISNKKSMNLFHAEGHPDKLMPNLKKTAQSIFAMYIFYLLIGTIAYRIVGMELFDGICHAMCALSTGGFSTKLNSIGEYNSLAIELVTIILMLIGTTNFAVLLLLTKKKWKRAFRVSEVRFMFGLFLIFIPILAFSLADGLGMNLGEGFCRAAFDLVSALSTTGYSTMSYATWPPFAVGILILMMLIGGGIGSTAGGMKMTRVYLMLRLAVSHVKKQLSPAQFVKADYYVKAQGKEKIDRDLAIDTTGFVVCYLILFVAGALLLTWTADCGLMEGMFEFASSLGTVGLSIGVTGPTSSTGTLIVEMFGMILGRLEIFIVLIGLYSGLNRIHRRLFKRND